MTSDEKEQVINEYKARQRVEMRNRVRESEAAAAAREAAAKTDPLAKAMLVKQLESRKNFYLTQIELVNQKLAALA